MEITRQEAIMRSHSWWFCENIINHSGQVGLLRLDFPRVFILIKDYEVAYWASYEAFKNDIIELNFLDPADRENADIDEDCHRCMELLGSHRRRRGQAGRGT